MIGQNGAEMAGRSKKGAERLLTLRGLTYWFRKAVPEDCTADYGANFFLVNLHSGDLRHVQGLRDRLEAGAKQIVQDIRAGRWANGRKLSLGGIDASGGGLLPEQRGELWQATLQQMESDPDTDPDQLELARYAEEQERERLRKAARRQFEKGRKGAFPIDRYLADYQKTIAALAPATVKGRGGHVATDVAPST